MMSNFKLVIKVVVVLVLACTLCSCARNFYAINPAQIRYDEGENAGDSLFVAYRMDMQYIFENDPYGNKEVRRKIMSVGIKITNRSSHAVRLTPSNFGIYGRHDEEKIIYSPKEYGEKVKQPAALYLFDPLGPCVGILDYLIGVRANKWNVRCQREHKIWNREILPYHSIYGLVSINARDREPLGFYFNPKSKPVIGPMELTTPYRPGEIRRTSGYHHYYIRLKNGTDVETFNKIDVTGCEQFILSEQGVKIRVTDTKWIYRIDGGTIVIGQPMEGCWLFQIINGSIKAFNFNGEDKAIVFLKKTDGPMVPFSPEALQFLSDDVAKVDELIFRQNYWKAIKKYNEQF